MSGPIHVIRKLRLKSWMASVSLGLWVSSLNAVSLGQSIVFTATDLGDTTPGQDLWLYSYQLSGYAFGAGEGFTITFDRSLFTLLQSPPPLVNAGWDVLTLQPDLAISSNGFYDALALQSAPSLADDFRVTAVWLGAGTPGAQPFTIHDTSFAPIVQGQTTPVPEPTTSLLILAGLVLAGLRRPARPER